MEQEEREKVISVACEWLGTPYHTAARKKGQGADCITFIAETFAEAGITQRIDIPPYSPQFHLHRDTERYLEGLLKYTREIEGPPKPGDIALWKFGRCFSHGAIVIEWPRIIHAYTGSSCRFENAETAHWLRFVGEGGGNKPRPVRFFSYWN